MPKYSAGLYKIQYAVFAHWPNYKPAHSHRSKMFRHLEMHDVLEPATVNTISTTEEIAKAGFTGP